MNSNVGYTSFYVDQSRAEFRIPRPSVKDSTIPVIRYEDYADYRLAANSQHTKTNYNQSLQGGEKDQIRENPPEQIKDSTQPDADNDNSKTVKENDDGRQGYIESVSSSGTIKLTPGKGFEGELAELRKKTGRQGTAIIVLLVFLILIIVGFLLYVAMFANFDFSQVYAVPLGEKVAHNQNSIQSIEEYMNVSSSSPCSQNPCVNGYCRTNADSYICVCENTWTGLNCSDEIEVNQTSSSLSLSWTLDVTDVISGWKVTHEEADYYPNRVQTHTYQNYTVVHGVRRLTAYRCLVEKVDFMFNYVAIHNFTTYIEASENSISFEWESQDDASENGYLVTVERIEIQKTGLVVLPPDANSIVITGLDACTDYVIHIWRLTYAFEEIFGQGIHQKTSCVVNKWKVGDSVVVRGWNGGAIPTLSGYHCNQPDNFPAPVRSPTCPQNNLDGKVGESITDAESHSGSNSWHYKRGEHKDTRGQGPPFAPQLGLLAGRSDGQHIGQADGFYARLWFKVAGPNGDNSSLEVSLGDASGSDRVSTMVYLDAYPDGVSVTTFEPDHGACAEAGNCSAKYTEEQFAKNLDLADWHKFEMELRVYNEDYGDRWTYTVDDIYTYSGGAYLQAWTFENKNGQYDCINRIRFRPRLHELRDQNILGFYFDDIYYEVFHWKTRNTIEDMYSTNFEWED